MDLYYRNGCRNWIIKNIKWIKNTCIWCQVLFSFQLCESMKYGYNTSLVLRTKSLCYWWTARIFFSFFFFVCLFVCLFCLFLYLICQDRVSLCVPGCPGTHSVDEAGLELRDLPASASCSVCHHCLALKYL